MPKQRQGITLVSSLIVIVIIVIALFPLLRALSISIFVSADTESTIIATNLSQSKMEEIRTLSYYLITSEAKSQVDKHPNFQSEVTVTNPQTDLKQIKVTIYWEDSGGTEDNISVESYATNY